jgi:hypothetical protein
MVVIDVEPAARIGEPRAPAGEVVGIADRPQRAGLAQVAAERVVGEGQRMAGPRRRQRPAQQVVGVADRRLRAWPTPPSSRSSSATSRTIARSSRTRVGAQGSSQSSSCSPTSAGPKRSGFSTICQTCYADAARRSPLSDLRAKPRKLLRVSAAGRQPYDRGSGRFPKRTCGSNEDRRAGPIRIDYRATQAWLHTRTK